MATLRVWKASSQLLTLASSRARTKLKLNTLHVRCCSSSSSATASASAGATSDRRRRSASSTNTSDRESVRAIRLKKVEELRQNGYEPYAYKWERSHTSKQIQEEYKHLENGEVLTGISISLAGRIIARRAFGKLVFLTLRDDSGTIQLYCEKESLSDDQFDKLKSFVDIGDILGANGSIKKTEKGELSIFVKQFEILTKSLLPLPDKYHGLTDIDKRYRQRYIDMIANPEVADVFRTRAKIVSEIRKTMESFGYIEVETPVLQGSAGGAEARPFMTYHNSLGRDLYLRIATELHLKRLLVGGLEKVYEIGRIFRNEGISTRHNPEFTSIEMYEAYSDYESMMNLAEEIITRCAMSIHAKLQVNYQGTEISLVRPWRRETMHSLVEKESGIDFQVFENDVEAAKEAAIEFFRARNNTNVTLLETCPSVGHVLNEVFETFVEPTLIQPTFVLDYPIEISPLAKPHRRHSGLTERFELFVCGREIGNAFSELTDPIDQRSRFEDQIKQHNAKRAALGKDSKSNNEGKEQKTKNNNDNNEDDYSYEVKLDNDFITSLEYGMPPASGMGLGIDRLVMLLTDSASIRDVIAFPILKAQQ